MIKPEATVVIAEAGVNHNGDIKLAKKLIDVACNAGADYVKFQCFNTDKLVTQFAPKAEYQKDTDAGDNKTQFDMLRKLELSSDEFRELNGYCSEKKIGFLATAFDFESLDFLNTIGQKFFKIPSGEITNLPYLKHTASFKKNIILSTGMANLGEIESAVDVLLNSGIARSQITLLHCSTDYPTPMSDVHLNVIPMLSSSFQTTVGYSDHTLGIEVPVAAVALGAKVIEKHFTLSRQMEGPDHKASLEPNELTDMVKCIRNIELALGSSLKKPTDNEIENKKAARRSIVASMPIKAGEVFTSNNLTTKRPGTGISPMRWNEVVGRPSIRNYEKDELISL